MLKQVVLSRHGLFSSILILGQASKFQGRLQKISYCGLGWGGVGGRGGGGGGHTFPAQLRMHCLIASMLQQM